MTFFWFAIAVLWYLFGFVGFMYFDRLPKKYPRCRLGWKDGIFLAVFGPITWITGALMEWDSIGRPGHYIDEDGDD